MSVLTRPHHEPLQKIKQLRRGKGVRGGMHAPKGHANTRQTTGGIITIRNPEHLEPSIHHAPKNSASRSPQSALSPHEAQLDLARFIIWSPMHAQPPRPDGQQEQCMGVKAGKSRCSGTNRTLESSMCSVGRK